MSSDLQAHLQGLDLGEEVALFELDCSAIGGPVLYFTPSVEAGGLVTLDLQDYSPFPIEAAGFDQSSQGAAPQPTVTIGNADRTFVPYLTAYQDLLGCVLTRTMIFSKYLDNGATPDPSAYHRRDRYLIDQKTVQDHERLEFRLVSEFDQAGRLIPRRQVLRRICQRRYRRWNGVDDFNYFLDEGGCPYAGTAYYLANGDATDDPLQDQCSKDLNGCRLRYPGEPLPIAAFLAVGDAQ